MLTTTELLNGHWIIESVEGYGDHFEDYKRYICASKEWVFSYPDFTGNLLFDFWDPGFIWDSRGLIITSGDLCIDSKGSFNVVTLTADRLVIVGEVTEWFTVNGDESNLVRSSTSLKISLKRRHDDIANL